MWICCLTKDFVVKPHAWPLSTILGLSSNVKNVLTNQLADDFKAHLASVHKMGDMLKCKMCPFTAACKLQLNHHEISVHTIGEAKYKCDLCPFKATYQTGFMHHIRSVHTNIKDRICEEFVTGGCFDWRCFCLCAAEFPVQSKWPPDIYTLSRKPSMSGECKH